MQIAYTIASRAAVIATRDAGVLHCYEDSLDSLVHWSAALATWLDRQTAAEANSASQLVSSIGTRLPLGSISHHRGSCDYLLQSPFMTLTISTGRACHKHVHAV